jgi:NAD(P)-dependent dehydrogenase (short-subunit alcohol dehydrogenase family)
MELRDKVAVVTGGASGIGRAIVLALADRGAHVVVADIDAGHAARVAEEAAAEGVHAVAVACDVAKEAQVEALAESAWQRFGRVDVLFNNAGVGGATWLLESTDRDLRWLFEVNVFGVWYGCRVFGRRFRDQGTKAWIVNTGSEHSLGMPHVQAGFYTATKHAVLGLTDVLRHELPPHIGVSILCPGVVSTDFWNAGRQRPVEHGGPVEAAKEVKAIMERGKDAAEIGRRAVEGVEREEFYIVTHPHARAYVEKRYDEIRAAFDRQAPPRPGEERFDVTTIALEVFASMKE